MTGASLAAMSDATPDRAPTPAPPADEISLRELYLVLKRRAPWIAGAAVLAAVVAFVVLSGGPATYVAEATAVVARAPIQVSLAGGLQFNPEVDVTYETYQTLAFSRGVLEAVLPLHEAGDLARLRGALTIERVAGSANQPSGLLAVVHRVRSGDPGGAAAAADAWAEATVAAARRLLLENLDAVETITGEDLAAANAELGALEAELERFQASAGVTSLRTRVGGAAGALGDATGGPNLVAPAARGTLDQAIADAEASLRRNRVASDEVAAELTALRARAEINSGDVPVTLFSAPGVVLTLEGAIASVEVRAAALEAERGALSQELSELRRERDVAVAALAEANLTLARLERAVLGPSEVVASLAAIEPAVAYVARVAPSGARVLSQAVVPSAPEPRRRTLIAALAAVVVGFGGVVVALLAEAVRDPRAARDPRPAARS